MNVATPNHRETASDYSAVVTVLNTNWRVIRCRDDIQWILQRRDGSRAGRGRWTGSSYHTDREALIAFCRTRAGRGAAAGMAILAALPERYPAKAGTADASR